MTPGALEARVWAIARRDVGAPEVDAVLGAAREYAAEAAANAVAEYVADHTPHMPRQVLHEVSTAPDLYPVIGLLASLLLADAPREVTRAA